MCKLNTSDPSVAEAGVSHSRGFIVDNCTRSRNSPVGNAKVLTYIVTSAVVGTDTVPVVAPAGTST
jgi:hypothetical protein